MDKVRTRSKSVKDDQLETVINSLTADQLRGVGAGLRVTFTGATKEDLRDSILNCGRPIKSILEGCYRAELYHQKKHLFLARYTGKLEVPKAPRAFSSKKFKTIGVVRYVYSDSTDRLQSMLFEHRVQTHELLPKEGVKDEFKLTRDEIRHPIAIHFNEKRKILQIAYHGYAQGRVKAADRVHYSDLVQELLRIIGEELGVTTHMLNIRESLAKLSMASDRRVIVNRTSPRTAKGELDLRGYIARNASAADVLTNLLSPYIPLEKTELANGIAEALKNALSETEIATWKKENISTRITYWPHGAEILFIWGGPHPTPVLVEELLDLILSAEQVSKNKEDSDAWSELLKMPDEQIFTVAQAVHAWHCSEEHCRKVLKLAIKASVVVPMFRIKSTRLMPEYANEWTHELASLAHVFKDEAGNEIDGAEPSNVEIAFLKLSTARQTTDV